MKVAQINMVPYGSTGKIMLQIAETAREYGHDVLCFVTEPFSCEGKRKPIEEKGLVYYGSFYENMIHNYLGKLFGLNGRFSYFGTKQLVNKLKEFSPDIVHLHNLHSFCIDLPVLFKYLRESSVQVVWTLHDCWAFTGHCAHFIIERCDKWKTGCYRCPQIKTYPKSYVDTSKFMYAYKRKLFTSVKNMTLVTPSEWLAGLVGRSFLKEYPVKVINNGIDLSVFEPTPSNFREKHGIPRDKFIVLGVAFGWGKRKGLDVFIELSKRLEQDKFQIVLVGTDEKVDKQLPQNIVSIHQTRNQTELAEIYTAADLFVNPTREEVLGMVNLEAIACGTPVVTFDTGGSPECIDETCGCVVACDDIDGLEKAIKRIYLERPYLKADCLQHAKSFDKKVKFQEYLRLYENCTHST